jgi:hypothetical protein
MNSRLIILLAALGCTACAQDPLPKVYNLQASNLIGNDADIDAVTEAGNVRKKSAADKMLTAIALERVTGRKPDPARLVEY